MNVVEHNGKKWTGIIDVAGKMGVSDSWVTKKYRGIIKTYGYKYEEEVLLWKTKTPFEPQNLISPANKVNVRGYKILLSIRLAEAIMSTLRWGDNTIKKNVYVISHPLYPKWYKIGVSQTPKTRLKAYNVADPQKRYKFEYVSPKTSLYKEIEDGLLVYFTNKGEWVTGGLGGIKEYITSKL